jgi:hypothetical protein
VATDFESLIPTSVASELIAAAEQESVAMRLGNVTRMPSGIESVPVVSVEPDAEWNSLAARKKSTTIEWTALRLEAEELAAVLAIPQAFLDDAGFPVWDQVRNRLASAFAKRIDETILFAVSPVPASFPASGVIGVAGAALSGADALTSIDLGLAAVGPRGWSRTGSRRARRSARRSARSTGRSRCRPTRRRAQPSTGLPVAITAYWDSTKGDAIVGDWSKLVIGVREDLRFETSTDAIIQDAVGAIIANAFQEDLVAMRCYMRVGAAIGLPVASDGTPAEPFKAVDWTA